MKFVYILTLLLINVYYTHGDDETTEHLTKVHGYPLENYWARTTDGYWLRLHRIPHGKNEKPEEAKKKSKDVFFLQHGLTASSSNFLWNKAGCLGFTLADAGFDVFLGNVRGNYYSNVHDFLKNSSKEFWDFTFDEMAKYDLPAMVERVIEITGRERIWYAAHSQGTMMMLAKLSEEPEFGFKIKGFFALAPLARLDNVLGTIKTVCKFYMGLKWAIDSTNIRKLPLPYHMLKQAFKYLCMLDKRFCGVVYAEIKRYQEKYIDWKKVPQVLAALFTEGDASVKNLRHYCQAMQSKKFQKFDYGFFGNLLNYWQRTPPQYDIRNIRTNMWLFSGKKDFLSSQENVAWIIEQTGNFVMNSTVFEKYDHLNFLWGTTAKKDIYDVIIKTVKDQTQSEMP